MAKKEHLVKLKQGVEVWNTWREEHPDVSPDLREADLSVTALCDCNFDGAIISYRDTYVTIRFELDYYQNV